jgi:hypothetical protein
VGAVADAASGSSGMTNYSSITSMAIARFLAMHCTWTVGQPVAAPGRDALVPVVVPKQLTKLHPASFLFDMLNW